MSRRRICCCTGDEPPPPDVMPARSACNEGIPPTFPARSYTFSVSGSIQSLVYGINTPPTCEPGTEFLAHTDCTPYAQQVDYSTYAPDCNPEDPQCRTNSKAVSSSSFSGTATITGGAGGSGGVCNSQQYFSSSSSSTLCDGADSFTPVQAVGCDQEYSATCGGTGACYNTSTISFYIGAGGDVTYSVTDANCDVTSVTTCLLTAMLCTYQRRKKTTDTWMAEGIYYLVQVQNREQSVGSCPDIADICGSVTSPISRAGVPSTITVTGF
jgi:hypothetical protein